MPAQSGRISLVIYRTGQPQVWHGAHSFWDIAAMLGGLLSTVHRTVLPPTFRFKLECDDLNKNALVSLIREHCPSISGARTAKQTRWLPSGHLQTLYTSASNAMQVEDVDFKRKVFLAPDGGTISMDIAPISMSKPSESDTTPTVVILHGLSGGSSETYVMNAVVQLTKSREEGGEGVRCVVVNFRGCAKTMLTSAQLYSACKVTDLESALLLLSHMFPRSPMLGLGYSLGGAVLARYMGISGKDTPFIGAITVGAPYSLDKTNTTLESSYLTLAYAHVLGVSLRGLLQQHVDTLVLSPALWEPIELILRTKMDPDESKPVAKPTFTSPQYCTLRYVDHTMTRLIGGYPTPYGEFPFASAMDYYKRSSPVVTLANVSRPLLALSADDDPIVPWSTLDDLMDCIKTNPNVVLAHTQSGGHLGWFAGPLAQRWIKHPIAEFVHALVDAHGAKPEESVSTGLGSGGPQVSPWKTRSIDKRSVQVEVLAKAHLPSVSGVRTDNEQDVAWLRTQILPHIPLIHPNDSPVRTHEIPTGRMLSLTLVRILCLHHSTVMLYALKSVLSSCPKTCMPVRNSR